MKDDERQKIAKKLAKIEKMIGGYEDKPVGVVKIQTSAPMKKSKRGGAEDSESQELNDDIASTSIGNQNQYYKDQLELADEMKRKIREVANMNTMGNVQLGLGEAWYQGQGMDDAHIKCPACGGKILVRKIKKKLFKRKVRRNAAKGKPAPKAPKFMREKKEKKKPGPKKGGAKSNAQSEWQKYCHAVAKTPKMEGKPWNEVLKKASKLRKEGVSLSDINAIKSAL